MIDPVKRKEHFDGMRHARAVVLARKKQLEADGALTQLTPERAFDEAAKAIADALSHVRRTL